MNIVELLDKRQSIKNYKGYIRLAKRSYLWHVFYQIREHDSITLIQQEDSYVSRHLEQNPVIW